MNVDLSMRPFDGDYLEVFIDILLIFSFKEHFSMFG